MATRDSSSIQIGRHLLADLRGIDAPLLRNQSALMQCLVESLELAGFTVLQQTSHKFPEPGGGVTGVVLLSESHAAFHTYPEHEYMAFDLFSCGSADPDAVIERLIATLQPTEHEIDCRIRAAVGQ